MMVKPVDLNLFRVFDMIMIHRSVVATGRELGVTASAVSHALTRLRRLLDDDLFISSAEGMVPTQRAIELHPGIRDGLGSITQALDARPFDPGQLFRAFGIAGSGWPGSILLPQIMARLLTLAPHANLRLFPLGRTDVVENLDDSRIDLVIGWFNKLPDRLRRQVLMHDQEAMVARAGHPLTGQKVTRQKLFGYPHAVIEFTGSKTDVGDGFLDDRGAERRTWIERLLIETRGKSRHLVGRVALTLPDYTAMVPVLLATDMIATLPLRLARRARDRDALVILDLPYAPLSVPVEMVWHERADDNPASRWLREMIAAVATDVEREEPLGDTSQA